MSRRAPCIYPLPITPENSYPQIFYIFLESWGSSKIHFFNMALNKYTKYFLFKIFKKCNHNKKGFIDSQFLSFRSKNARNIYRIVFKKNKCQKSFEKVIQKSANFWFAKTDKTQLTTRISLWSTRKKFIFIQEIKLLINNVIYEPYEYWLTNQFN